MKNIHVLPTDKKSKLVKRRITGEIKISSLNNPQLWDNVNIYITNDEEIKKGDWYWKPDCNMVFKAEYTPHKGCKKIILTTDKDLIKDGVQAIDDEFLEWFVNNSSCEFINAYFYKGIETGHYYRIDIPKEEPKQFCEYCKIEITKYGCGCGTEKPKQETLEEVAEKESEYLADWEDKDMYKKGFIDGAKWQQQQNNNLYSEEEVLKLLHNYRNHFELYRNIQVLPNDFFEWFNQNKKK